MSKYAGLPDIDTAPDVYETPDPVGDFSYEHDSDSDTELPLAGTGPTHGDNEDIINERLDTAEARRKFKEARLRGDADFSSTLAPRKGRQRPLYPTQLPDTTTYEILPRGYSTDNGQRVASTSETPLQRLRRLRYELEEVETQLEASKETAEAASAPGKGEGRSEVPTGALLSQLRFLRNDLTRLSGQAEVLEGKGEADKAQTGNLLQRIASPTSSALPSLPPPSSATVVTPTNAVDLDDRLVKLERFVGASEADVDESHPIAPSLITTLSKLEHQLQLLTQPRHLDTVARRVKTLVGDLERIHEARRKLGDTRPLNIALSSSGITVLAPGTGLPSSHSETTLAHNQDGGRGEMELPPDALQKIEALSNVLPRLEPLLPLAPSLLARLRTLAPLHASSAAFSRELSDVSREVAGLREAEGGLREALKGLEMSFEANEKTVKGNLEVLEGRIESLTRKFP